MQGRLRGGRFYGRWTAAVTAGTVVAFGVGSGVLALLDWAGVSDALFWLLAVLGAAASGAVLGWAQGTVLRQALPGLRRVAWARATAAGTALVCAAAITPRALRPHLEGRTAFFLGILFFAVLVVVMVALGGAQWLVLRRHLDRALKWVWVSAGAWFVGLLMGATVWTLSTSEQSILATVLIGGVGALVMAITMATLTGLFFVAALDRPPSWRPAVS